MKVFIAGGSGFIGTQLSINFLKQGHEVIGVGGSSQNRHLNHEFYTYVSADTTTPGEWQKFVKESDIIINLAGRTIFHYWTTAYKKQIYNSRIKTTQNIVSAIAKDQKATFINASAVGIYGDAGEDTLNETHSYGNDFLASVCKDWEREAKLATSESVNLAILRFGVVLDAKGGAFPTMLMPYKFLVGGSIGSGQQWFPWIHIYDLIGAINHIIEKGLRGDFNLCSPLPVRNRESVKIISEVFKKSAFLKTPGFIIRLALREFGDILLFSQRGYPDNLLKSGFEFKYPEFKKALEEIKSRL